MRFLILGPLEVRGEDGVVALGGIKLRAVLAMLLLHANEAVSAERLALALWGDEAPSGASKTVQVHVWRLRKALGDRELISTTPAGYCLRVDPDELDAVQFERLVRDGRGALAGGDPERAAAVLREALSLWRGPALGELACEPFARAEIERLEEQRLAALEARIEADLAAGQHAELVAELRRLVAVDPTRELLTAQLMLALYRCGRQTDALEAYQEARSVLVADIGIEPGPRLRELHEAILHQDAALESVVPRLPPARDAVRVSRSMGRDEPTVLAVPRSLQAPNGSPFLVSEALDLQPRAATKPATAAPASQQTALIRAPAPAGLAPPVAAAARARRVRFRLPLAAATFAGRNAELDAIDEALGVGDRAVVTQAITGLGGVGKSQLTARYVHDHADEYDIVAWIRAEDGGIADLSELAAELGLPVTQLTPAECATGAVRWLSVCEQRWLLVLDNLTAPEQLGDCCPSSGNGRVIVTTRDREMAQFGPALAVDVFDEPTAVAYLLARAGRDEDPGGAVGLARALGFLPLALSHAGAYCAAGTSFDEYLQLLGALPAAELFDDHPEVSYAQTVASTWQVSIQAADRQAPLARQVLTMAAHLAPDAIPRELFEVLLDDNSTAPARKRLLDAFNALHQLSLAQIDDETVSVHRLLQKTIRDDLVPHGDDTVALRALGAVAAAFPRDVRQPRTWPQCERLLPHALAITTALEPSGEAGPRLVTLLNRASEYLHRADSRARAVDTATRALACARRILGPEHPETLRVGAILAGSYRYVGRTAEAIELGERVLADSKRILGPEHPDTLTAGTMLVVSYWDAGRAAEAIELGERVLADSKRILGAEHPDTLTAGTMLALAYWAAGRNPEAIRLEERILTDSKRILGPERPETLNASVTLALYYAEAGRVSEAIELGERVLPDCVRIFGPEHPDTLSAGAVLVVSYAVAGRTSEAIDRGEEVLTDCERILGPEHPTTLRACSTLAIAYQQANRTTEAIELWKRVLATYARLLGANHFYTLGARANLAATYAHAGHTNAIELLERALADSMRILGPKHPVTLRANGNLANAYREPQRTHEATTKQHVRRDPDPPQKDA